MYPLNSYPTKWSNTLKQFVGKLSRNCLSVFEHFVGLVLRGFFFGTKIDSWKTSCIKGCVCYILGSLLFMSKREHL